jgi:signal transduction histidine kinase
MARKIRAAESAQTVLVVDDQEEVLDSVRAVLEHAGYRVVTAQSAAAALTAIARGDIDLVLGDLVMPGMPGDELIRRIRSVDASVPIVLHTGCAIERPPAELVAELGIQGYHQKADGPEQLLLWVASALRAPDPAARLRARADGQHELIVQVSHGLRTPLQQIGGYIDLLLDGSYGELPQAARAPLLSLARTAHDLTRLLTNVLTHTRLAARAFEVDRRRVAVDELAAQLRSVADTLLVGRPVRFAVETKDAPAALHTDPQAVRAILINLLDNAAKSTASGLITLSIVREGSAARLTIADTGPGIPPDDLAHLLQPFRFGAGSVAQGGTGLGLGLAVSRQLAELLGGELSAQSQPGVGSAFSLLLRGVVPNGDASTYFRPWPDDTPGGLMGPDDSRAG